ncbi:MAG: hypothetical protein WCV68_00815 [Candidatus Paceibacterota bacterium]
MMNAKELANELKGFWNALDPAAKKFFVRGEAILAFVGVAFVPFIYFFGITSLPTTLWVALFSATELLVLYFMTLPIYWYISGKNGRREEEARELAEHARAIEIIDAMRVAAGQDELDQAIETLERVGISTGCFLYFPAHFPEAIWATHVEASPDDFAKCLATLITKHEVESPLGNRFAQTQEFYRRVYLFLLNHNDNSLSLRTAACLGSRVGRKIRDTAFGS